MKATVNKITATKAARNFSDLLSRVQYRKEEFQITRGNEVVAVISPFGSKPRTIGELQEAMKSWPKLDADDSASWLKEIEELRETIAAAAVSMGVILDTGIIILAERGVGDLAGILRGESYGISAVTVSELFFGYYRANSPARRERREKFIATVLEQVPVYDFTAPIARIHARLRSALTERGQIIGAHDLMIAATALHLGWSVKTANEGEFRRVEGLDVIGSSA